MLRGVFLLTLLGVIAFTAAAPYDAAQDAAEDHYHAGEAASRAAAEAARNDAGYTGGRDHDPVATGGARVYESDNGRFRASVGASSNGNDHGVAVGGSWSW